MLKRIFKARHSRARSRHSRESGNLLRANNYSPLHVWIPAFAGMTILLYIAPIFAEDKPPPPSPPNTQNQNNNNITQDALTQINQLFIKSSYKDFQKQPKLELFKIPAKP